MKLISPIIAILSFVAGIACIFIIPKYGGFYADSEVVIPQLTIVMVNTSGWIPGGIFLLLSVLLVILIFLNFPKISMLFSIASSLLFIGSAVIIPMLLLKPLSQIIKEEHEERDNKKAVSIVEPSISLDKHQNSKYPTTIIENIKNAEEWPKIKLLDPKNQAEQVVAPDGE